MAMYVKENGKIYRVTTHKDEINLGALKRELKDFQKMEAPTDEELIELGKMSHPYYADRDRIESLKAIITKIEKQVK